MGDSQHHQCTIVALLFFAFHWCCPNIPETQAYLASSTTSAAFPLTFLRRPSLHGERQKRSPSVWLSTNQEETTVSESSPNQNLTLVDIASSITLEQCPLLGVKSLGVDYGLVKTGVALTSGYSPKPLVILTDYNQNLTIVSQRILEYAKAEQVQKIIVGMPLHKNGTIAEQTNLTWIFCQELAVQTLEALGPNVPVELWDERYTSKEAAARAHAIDPHRSLYRSLDAEAACLILEHYYHDHGQGRLVVPVLNETKREAALNHFEARQLREREERQTASLERSGRLQRRREAIAESQRTEQEQSSETSKKKKKKKKRR